MNINMDMGLRHINFTTLIDGDSTENGIKAHQYFDDVLCLKEIFNEYVLFEVSMFFAGKIDIGKSEPKEFCKHDVQLVYVEKRLLKDCGDGNWFISTESHKYIFNNLCNAKPNQIRLIVN